MRPVFAVFCMVFTYGELDLFWNQGETGVTLGATKFSVPQHLGLGVRTVARNMLGHKEMHFPERTSENLCAHIEIGGERALSGWTSEFEAAGGVPESGPNQMPVVGGPPKCRRGGGRNQMICSEVQLECARSPPLFRSERIDFL